MGNRKGAHHHKTVTEAPVFVIEKKPYRVRTTNKKPRRGAHGVRIRAAAASKTRRCESCGAPIFRNVGYAREEYEFEGAKTLISLNIDECSVCKERFPRDADVEESDFLKLKFCEQVLARDYQHLH